ncbi:MAG: hypothetical protein GKC04_06475 [Methanomicrobiales archaeon]|nr:hypothetical protein [Methanomicrobiales archaeon]
MARIIPNSGRSVEEAVVIEDAADHLDGIAAEYRYLEERYGKEGVAWKLKFQFLLDVPPEEGGGSARFFDKLIIELADGSVETVYFNIGSFFDMA